MVLVALVLSLPFLYVLLRRPVARRLAVRHALRRPREGALVVLGSLLGTAIVTGSLVAGDTLDASIRASAHRHLGPVDELVVARDPAEGPELQRRLAGFEHPRVDGVLPLRVVSAPVATAGEEQRRAAPDARVVEVDFDAARDFGGEPGTTGIDGATPAPGRTAVSRALADVLEVGPGDRVEVFAYGRRLPLEVDRVLPERGIAGFDPGLRPTGHNVLVAPGTLDDLVPDRAAGRDVRLPRTMVAVSNVGGVEEGADATEEVSRALAPSVEGLAADVQPVKQQVLDRAEASGSQLSQMFTTLGVFGILAGVLLLVNIFVMLAEERKSELGMARALGLRRGALVATFSTEGWLYALAASLLGTLAGIGLGRLIVGVPGGELGEGVTSLRFAVEWASVQQGFVAGFVIAVLTVVVTSLRISRINIIRAIRDLPPERHVGHTVRRGTLGALALVAGGVWAGQAFATQQPVGVLLGPLLAVLGAAALLRPVVPSELLGSTVGAVGLVWGLVAYGVTDVDFSGGPSVFVVQGLVLTAAAVALLTTNQHRIGALLRAAGRGTRSLPVRLGLAYPLAHPFRTGMTLAMYAMVMFVLTSTLVFSAMFSRQIDASAEQVSGGFDVIVHTSASNPLPPDELSGHPGVDAVAPLQRTVAEVGDERLDEPRRRPVAAFDARFVDLGPPPLTARGDYPSDRAAYRAVLDDPGLVLVRDELLTDFEAFGPPDDLVLLEVGDEIVLEDPASGRRRRVEVAGLVDEGLLFDADLGTEILVGADAARDLFGARLAPDLSYVRVAAGTDAGALSRDLDARFVAHAAQARTFHDLVVSQQSSQQQFFQLIQGYLALGLVVGLAGLGVVMVRAVRERRHQIGVLRALGFNGATVGRAFLLESAFVAVEGVVVGIALALVTTFNLVSNTDIFGEQLAFTIPTLPLAALAAGTVAVSLLTTAAPARSASRIQPAVALRITD